MPMVKKHSGTAAMGGAPEIHEAPDLNLNGHSPEEVEAFDAQQRAAMAEEPPMEQQDDMTAPPEGQPSAPAWFNKRLGEMAAQKNAALQAATEAERKIAAMEAKLATLERFVPGAQTQESQEAEWQPTIPQLPPRPESMDEDTYNFMTAAIHDYAAQLFNANVPTYLDHRIKPFQQSIEQVSGSVQSVQQRESLQAVNGVLSALESQYPALKDPEVKADLKAMWAGHYGGQEMNDALLKQLADSGARFAARFGRPAASPVNPAQGAPRQAMPGTRNGAPGPIRNQNPREWRSMTPKTLTDILAMSR